MKRTLGTRSELSSPLEFPLSHNRLSLCKMEGVGSSSSEARFSHLLEPIRDLAQNWNVDIASEVRLRRRAGSCDARGKAAPSSLTPGVAPAARSSKTT